MFKNHSICIAVLAGLAVIGSGMVTGCNPDDNLGNAHVEVSVASVTSSSAEVVLSTSGVAEYAYVVYTSDQAAPATPSVIFRDGTSSSCSDGTVNLTVGGLSPLTDYTIYVAGLISAENYLDDVASASFSTTDLTTDLLLVDTYYDGFTMQVRVPDEVIEREHVLRYTMGNLLMYNSNKEGMMANTDAANLEANGDQYTQTSITVTYNDDNIYNGQDEFGEDIYLHDPIVPGEPLIFLAGEFGWGESMYGWGEGWYSAMFDFAGYDEALWGGEDVNEADYWTGHYAKMEFTSRMPEVLDATVNIEPDMQAVTGTLRFTPEDGVYQYCVCVLDETSYQMVLHYLNNNEDYLQWFTTSYYAAMMLGMTTLTGNAELNVEDYLYLQENTEYHVFLTAMGDEEGMSQSFVHDTFSTTPKQLEAPEVTVTPVEGSDPFTVTFNVKNTGNVPVASAMYAANYERDWAGALNMGMTYYDIISQGNAISSAEDIAAINSEDGLDLTFTTIDGMTTRLGVLVYNSEETANDVNAENSPAIAEVTAPDQPDAERVDSRLFDSLVGDWTMTADVSVYDYSQGAYVSDGSQSTKVSIYNGLDDYPDSLPEDVYDNYADMSREEVDALYDEFKMESEAFNAKVRGQNRLLCVGFGYNTDESTALNAATPYELFCSPDYGAYDVASLFYDFGPKWYLEVSSDGSVAVPLNSTRMYPLQAWTDNIYYLAAFNSDAGYMSVGVDDENEYIPVTVASGDGQITVGPLVDEDVEFLPNVVYFYYGSYVYIGGKQITSAPVLTKGWTGESASASSVSSSARPAKTFGSFNGVSSDSFAARPKSRTSFKALKKYEKSDYKIVPADEFEASLKAYAENHRR